MSHTDNAPADGGQLRRHISGEGGDQVREVR